MKSLTQGGESNLQDRVIQSGLDAITGTDASSIVTLFKAMAVYAEGTVTHILSHAIHALKPCFVCRRNGAGCDSERSLGVAGSEEAQVIVGYSYPPMDVATTETKHLAWFCIERGVYG